MKFLRWILPVVMMAATADGEVTKKVFGKMPNGASVDVYTLRSASVEVRVTTYGARLVSVRTADRAGKMADVVLGYDSLDGYLKDTKTYFGGIVGRYGNRIAGGKFVIDGQAYQIPLNNGANTLHGGTVGFDQALWSANEIANGVEMTLVSRDGDMGYPGTLTLHVRYTLVGGALHIDYSASTDKTTVINVTNHAYFNLRGDDVGDVLGHEIQIAAERYTPVDAGLIPTGELATVAGTPFDFRNAQTIGARVHDDNAQLKFAGGYDHNWVLSGIGSQMKMAARLYEPVSGRVMTVMTTEPGLQFYSGNFLDGTFTGRHGVKYAKYAGLCLETQHFPDSPNHAKFPSTLLKPGHVMRSSTVYTFSVQK